MSKKFHHVGFIGFGERAQNLSRTIVTTLPEYAEVVAGFDVRDINVPDDIASRCNKLRLYKNHKEMLADSEIDTVFINTYEDTHLQFAMDAINAGKAVYCDKPVVQDLKQAEQLYKFVAGRKCFFQIGLNLPYFPVSLRLKELLEQNAVGRIICVRASCDVGAGFMRRHIMHKFAEPRIDFPCAKITHDTDLTQWLLNTYAEEVWGMADNFRWRRNGKEPVFNDTAVIAGKYHNGAFFTQTLTSTGCSYKRRIEIFGTEGEISADLHGDEITINRIDQGKETVKISQFSKEGHCGADTRIIRDYFDYLDQEVPEPRWPERILSSLMVPLAALEDGVVKTGEWYRSITGQS
jgi:predicted dehydrogenase